MNYHKGVNVAPFSNRVLLFKIELSEILPLIWRRISVPSDYNFWDLHVAIQDSLGWLDYHLHHFEIKGKGKKKEDHIGIPDFERNEGLKEVFPGWEIPVINYFNDLGVKAKYIYDYGDCWLHEIQLEGYLFRENKTQYPVCIDGERACPPEDCGGADGYFNLIKIFSEPENEDNAEKRAWVGKDWNPDRFDKHCIKFSDPYKRWVKAFLESPGF